MDERIKQQLQQRLATEKSYEKRALLYSVEHFIKRQEQRIHVQASMVDALSWDHKNW